jgi:hypothetical protein
MNEWPDHLDKELDDALTSYGKAPDNLGLQQRILVRVNTRTTRRRRMKLLTAATGMAALAAGFLCWWVTPRVAVRTQPLIKTRLVFRKPESLDKRMIPLRNGENVLTLAKGPRRSRKQRAEPKLPQFPMASSVGSEERALVQLAMYKAEHATEESSYLGGPVTPIQIPAVDIKPIE